MQSLTESTRNERRFGDFALGREIGRGGMGIVYEAQQLSLNRKVALKVLAAELGLTPKAVERFRREAEAAAKLHHTNIVPIYATGEQDGAHFYAMEFIEGASLDRVLRQIAQERARPAKGSSPSAEPVPAEPSPDLAATTDLVEQTPVPTASDGSSSALSSGSSYFDNVARMIADVADALDHAHKHDVIHRDIKPSNLLLCSDGRLTVSDFGLARMLEKPGVTMTGEFVGTPAYMSPEQITAGRVPLDHRTDIYSLGATLYELLTLKRPFLGDGRDQVLAQILQKDPLPPRKIDKKIPLDLETICLKALDKDPDRRYQSARAMAEDLRRHVQRFAILARRAGPLARAAKWTRRHPAVTLLLAGLLVTVLATGFFAYQAHIADRERQASDRRRLAEQQQHAIDKAQLAAMSGDFDQAREALDEAGRLGISTAEVHLLRGQIAFHSGNMAKAVEDFKQAVALQPESVAARALLASACLEAGDNPRHGENLDQARRLTPVTADDYLFLGRAEAVDDPDKALRLLEAAVQKRPSVIARLVHAEALTSLAKDRGDAALAERAARQAEAVRQLLGDNPVALRLAVEARTVALYAYAASDQHSQRQAAIRLTRPDAEALKRFPHYPYALPVCWQFLRAIGEQDTLLETLRKSSAAEEYVVTLYRRGEFAKARTVLGKDVPPVHWFLVLSEFPDGRTEALQLYEKLAKEGAGLQGWDQVTNQMALLLLGHLEKSRVVCRDYRRRGLTSPIKNAELQRALAYLSGELPAQAYLEATGESRVDRTNAHFFIGLTNLAEGKRPAAREHFRKAVQTGAFLYYHYEMSWGLLGRMEQDPRWPSWISSQQ